MTKKEQVLETALEMVTRMSQDCSRCPIVEEKDPCHAVKTGGCIKTLMAHFKNLAQRKVG